MPNRGMLKGAMADNPASKYFRTRDVNPYIGSPSAYEQAHRWIKECCESHIDCPKRTVGPLPTRVIDVQSLSASGDPRLFITERLEAEYATLSYCWGSEQPESLTKERLPRYLEGIPVSSMPQTIQDAITVTKELGLRYLWIDSLCIIQNSKEDKRAEISKMRQIFKHSLVTISAANARSVSQGFLAPRPQPIPSIRITLRCPDGSGGVVLLYSDGEEPHLRYEESDHPIESRAWTLEEKVLSPRALIYSSTHLRWLCDSSQYSDGGAQENFMNYEPAKYRLPVKERKRPYHPSDNNVSSLSLYDSWHTLVGEYTRRCLTAPEDKLRAIGGLAEEYHLLMNDTYLAGLWKSKLGIELIWRRNSYSDAGKLSSRPIKYRAPSWSWASVDGEVAIKWKPIELVKFNIDGCEITPLSTSAPFGEVAKGILKVRARLKDAWFDPVEEGLFDKDGNRLANVVPDALEKATLMPGAVKSLAISANHGLVLVPTESDENVYRRVGWQYFSNDDFFDGCEQRIVTIV
jgi:Heterokaryon incompatibility protein (HET)